jgi:archaeal flagellar protein FlaI
MEKKYQEIFIDYNLNPPLLRDFEDKTKINVRYPLVASFCYAHIFWDPKHSELIYHIEEPQLNEYEKKYCAELILAIREAINFEFVVANDNIVIQKYLNQMLQILVYEFGLDLLPETYEKIYYYICRDFIGFNRADPLIRDYYVEDIECNGAKTPVYIVHRKFRNIKTNLIYENIDELSSFIEKLAQRGGKYVSYARPILDSSLPDGSRVNATYTKDITTRGPTFTIRKFTKTPWTPSQLVSFETLSAEMLAYLWLLVEHKMNILVAGGTGSGKTTLLNALGFFIPSEARVVSIEDTRELNLPRENWLPSVVRNSASGDESDSIDLFALLKASFRQNPDYVIVGEVRGKEAFVLFQGMASGHSSISTIHADSVDAVIKRLETPPIELSPTLLNTLDCVCIMSHAIVQKKGTRKLKEIVEVVNVSPEGIAMTNTPFVWNALDDKFYFKKESKILEKISKRSGLDRKELDLEFDRRVKLIYELFKRKVFDFKKTQDVIQEYYKNPENVLKEYGL